MNLPEHSLPILDETPRQAVRNWLMLGVVALGFAGIFAGMLANTKSIYFYTALVAHVDLSVLVWFLAFACLLMTLAMPDKRKTLLGKAAFIATSLGTAGIAASAFTQGTPFQNNYVPVIYHPLFFMGLSLLFCGVTCLLAQFVCSHTDARKATLFQAGVVSLAAILLMAVFCFFWSYRSIPADLHGQAYYEQLFWAGGHVLQIAYAQEMVIAWLWLAEIAGIRLRLSRTFVLCCYAIGVVAGLAGLVMSLFFAPGTMAYHDGFMALMKHANGLPGILIGAGLIYAIAKDRPAVSLPFISLIMSMLLFVVGGFLGYLIHGSNETVPAHYHGSIVGVTLALMGLAYLLLPQLGFANVAKSKLARMQPVIYGGGQLCWMMGMAIGGSQGIGRKLIDSAEVIGGMGGMLKHSGDGLSLIGGLLFVFVMVRAMVKKNNVNLRHSPNLRSGL